MPPKCLKIIVSIDWKHPFFIKQKKPAIVFPLPIWVKNVLSIQNAVRFS